MRSIGELFGCIILYNPKNEVFSRIKSYAKSLDYLIVIDNSEEKNRTLLEEIKLVDNCGYLFMGRNAGISEGVNTAFKMAFKDSYSWFFVVDQDTVFEDFDVYIKSFLSLRLDKNVALCSPSHFKEMLSQPILNDNSLIMTSGNIISCQTFVELNGYDEKLFIDEVDHDFLFKLRMSGYTTNLINTKILHPVGKAITIHFFGKALRYSLHPPARLYYIVRNNLYMFERYEKTFPGIINFRKKRLLKTVLINIIFDVRQVFRSLYFIIRGYFDYRRKIYGKFVR